ncbi:MAG: hypothetical protein ACRDK3_06475 [Actinomycetota bacterium]
MRAGEQLRPLGLGEILDVGIKIYTRNALTLFRIVAVVVIPVQFLTAVITLTAIPGSFAGPMTGRTEPQPGESFEQFESEIWTFLAAVGLIFLLTFLSSTLATAASFKAVGTAYLGGTPDWRSSLSFATRKLHSVLWVSILSGLFIVLGLIALIVPGIWLYGSYAVALPALLTEDTRGTKALRRSFRLVRHRWWPTFGLLILTAILAGLVGQAISLVFTGLIFTPLGDGPLGSVVINALSSTVASVLTTPAVAAITSVLYFDLRVRKEGFDLQLLAQRIGATGTGPSLAPAAGEWGGWASGHPESPGRDQPPYWPPPPGWQPSPGATDHHPPGQEQPPPRDS